MLKSADNSCFAVLRLISAAQSTEVCPCAMKCFRTTKHSYTGIRIKPEYSNNYKSSELCTRQQHLVLARARILNQTCTAASEETDSYNQICGQRLFCRVRTHQCSSEYQSVYSMYMRNVLCINYTYKGEHACVWVCACVRVCNACIGSHLTLP